MAEISAVQQTESKEAEMAHIPLADQPPPYPGEPTAAIPAAPQQNVTAVAGIPPPGGQYPPSGGAVPFNPLSAVAAAYPQLAGNLPPQEVTWMPLPTEIPLACPPGLEYLTQIDQILVHQQIELFELVTGFETENKYRVRNTLGQQVYFASERSTPCQRQCCGPGREFSMSISDNTQREVIHLERPLRCYYNCSGLTCYCCCSCCAPHEIEVQSPPGTVIGYVRQDPLGILRPWFSIENAEGECVLKIKGPTLGCSCYSDANFDMSDWLESGYARLRLNFNGTSGQKRLGLVPPKCNQLVLSADDAHSVGRISKQWGGLAKEIFTDADNFGIQFPIDLDVKMKAVMIAACFLIDFMFFETPANQGGANRHHHHHRRY